MPMQLPGGRLGDYLLQRGLVTKDQILEALDHQRERPGSRFVDVLVELGFLAKTELTRLLPRAMLIERIVDSELTSFADSFVHERYEVGQAIFREGELGRKAYVVLEGQVKIFTGDAHPHTLELVGQGQVFGEMALLDGAPRSANAAAVTATELMVLTRDDFLDQIRRTPEVAMDIFKLLARRLRRMDQTVTSILDQDLPAKLRQYVATVRKSHGDGQASTVSLAEVARSIGAPEEVVRTMAVRSSAALAIRVEGQDLVL